MTTTPSPKPLSGVKVLEFAGQAPSAFATMMLADMGADIVVIERAGPGKTPPIPVDFTKRAKHFLTLNLKDADDKALALALIAKADIVIEGYRPGVMEKLGLGPTEAMAHNPALIYGRLTGWGQDGPLAHAAGHDINYAALSGALYAVGDSEHPPVPPLNLIADYAGGSMMLIAGVLAGLYHATTHKKGCVVDAAMVDGASYLMTLMHSLLASGIWNAARYDNLLDGAAHFYGCYKTSDNQFVAIGAIELEFMAEFCALAGLDTTIIQQHFNRQDWPQLRQIIAERIAQKPLEYWRDKLEGTDACFAPVLPFWQAHTHPHNAARHNFMAYGPHMIPAPAPRFDGQTPQVETNHYTLERDSAATYW